MNSFLLTWTLYATAVLPHGASALALGSGIGPSRSDAPIELPLVAMLPSRSIEPASATLVPHGGPAWLAALVDEPSMQTPASSMPGVLCMQLVPTTGGQSVPPSTGGTWRGPGDSVPASGGSTHGGGKPIGGSGPDRGIGALKPVASGGAPASPGPSVSPTSVNLTTTDDDGWWLWWEYNKVEFLRPNRLDFDFVPASGDDPADRLRRAAALARREVLPHLFEGLADPDAYVRAAAAIALGRTAGKEAVPALVAALGDANLDVRYRSILGLGATGSVEGATKLVSIARSGTLGADGPSRIAPSARAYAIVALGLMRAQGFEAGIDAEIARIVGARRGAERESIAVAALVYQTLAPDGALERLALELARDADESPSVRCRALEALRCGDDDRTFAALQRELRGARIDLRRSAALALGTFGGDSALASMQTAFELEAEPLTRGFLLTSIGRRGTPEARRFLEKELERGESGLRRWAALGLGLWARRSGDGSVAASIRTAQEREKNRDVLGAYWIALGLARDGSALPRLVHALATAGDPRERKYAATGLALIGGEGPRDALLEALKGERQADVRTSIAQSLGVLGVPGDAEVLAGLLGAIDDPYLQSQVVSAVAVHGTPEALAALRGLLATRDGSSVRRAAVIEGLGLLLARSTPLRLGEVSRQANYTVFSDWLGGLFQTTL